MAELSDYELLKAAGFSDEEILAEAGFSSDEIAPEPSIVDRGVSTFKDVITKGPIGAGVERLPGGFVQSVAQGATLGMADEASAGLRAGIVNPIRAALTGSSSPSYDEELAALRNEMKEYRKQSPATATIAEIGGSALPAIASGGMSLTLPRIAGIGAASGAAYGFGAGEGGIEERAKGAAIGGAMGAAIPSAISRTKQLVRPAMSKIAGKAASMTNPVADSAILQHPGAQAALRIAERQGFTNRPVSQITKVTPAVQDAVNTVSSQASQINNAIAAQLGADAGDTAVEKALSKDFKRAADRIVSSGILEKAGTVEELKTLTKQRLVTLGQARERAATQLDSIFERVNSADTPRDRMIGAVSRRDLAGPIKELQKRVGELENTKLAQPISSGIKSTMRSILSDLAPPSDGKTEALMSPKRILNMTKNLNEVRANLMKEFDSSNVARVVDKNSPTYAAYQGSIEAISKLQQGLYRALENKVDELSRVSGQNIPRDIFTEINSEYGALRALESMSDKFLRGISKGRAMRDPTRIVQNAGSEQILPNAFTPRSAITHGLSSLGNRIFDRPNDALRRAGAVERMSGNAMSNIHDYIQMSQSGPIQWQPYQGGKLDAIAAALGAPSQSGALAPTQAVGGALLTNQLRGERSGGGRR